MVNKTSCITPMQFYDYLVASAMPPTPFWLGQERHGSQTQAAFLPLSLKHGQKKAALCGPKLQLPLLFLAVWSRAAFFCCSRAPNVIGKRQPPGRCCRYQDLAGLSSQLQSVVGAHRVMSQLTECPVCRGSRRRGTDAVTAAGSCLKAENGHLLV